jgi:hypothetical protein
LPSRFPENQRIPFSNYEPPELIDIFNSICSKNNYSCDKEFNRLLHDYVRLLSTRSSRADFGNAREMRSLFQICREELALRISESDFSPETKEAAMFIAADILRCTSGLGIQEIGLQAPVEEVNIQEERN